jgi:hypothetical protein
MKWIIPDSQKGNAVGSPFSLQLAFAFSSPLSLDKDLSACMVLLRNSPAKACSESPLNFTGDENLQEANKEEQLGTSHALDEEDLELERVIPMSKMEAIVLFPILLFLLQSLQEKKRKKIIPRSEKQFVA